MQPEKSGKLRGLSRRRQSALGALLGILLAIVLGGCAVPAGSPPANSELGELARVKY